MATVEICDHVDLFKSSEHIASSFQFYNGLTGEIIDETIRDSVNLLKWNSQLRDGNGGHYRDLTDLRARVKFHYENEDSDWVELGSYDQTNPEQPVYSCDIE